MIDIKEIYKKTTNQSQIKDLSEQQIISSIKISSKDIPAVFKRDIVNVLINFLLLIPLVAVLLTSKNINIQSITLCIVIFLASIYITIKKLLFIRKWNFTGNTLQSFLFGLFHTIPIVFINPNFILFSFFYSLTAGFVLGMLANKSSSILLSILARSTGLPILFLHT